MTPSQTQIPRISAFVICLNEESQIRRCLESVAWCSEIVVVDSGSTDRTIEICKEYTDKILFRGWTGYVDQKRFGLEHCTGTWIINLDADEEVSPELRAEITNLIERDAKNRIPENGFMVNRVVHYLGRWWRKGGWYPEYRLRLCRKSHTTWGGNDPHEKAIVQGPTPRLKGELYHYTYSNIADQVARLNSFSTSAARTLQAKGAKTNLFAILLRPLFRFIKFYFVKRGFLDGFPGFLVAILEMYYVFLKYIKLWELNRSKG